MAIIPIYYETHPVTGKTLWGLAPQDFYKVVNGYGCPECLEDYNGVFLPVCPLCNHASDLMRDVQETPDHFKPGEAAPAPEPW